MNKSAMLLATSVLLVIVLPAEKPPRPSHYVNEYRNFCLDYPSDWEKDNTSHSQDGVVLYPDKTTGENGQITFSALPNAQASNGSRYKTLEEIAFTEAHDNPEKLNFKKLSETMEIIKGHQGLKLVISYQAKENERKMMRETYNILEEEHQLVYFAEIEGTEEFVKKWEGEFVRLVGQGFTLNCQPQVYVNKRADGRIR